jgi:acylaminoacyl-peptidase
MAKPHASLHLVAFVLITCGLAARAADSSQPAHLSANDVFRLEWAANPQISPDGRTIVYQRSFMDLKADLRRSNLWQIDTDGSRHRPLTSGSTNDSGARWSPDGTRLAYVSKDGDGSPQIFIRWLDTGETYRVTQLTNSPGDLAWSPDGKLIAFTMAVPVAETPLAVPMPKAPEGAEWADPPTLIDRLVYRFDGQGYLPNEWQHVFVVPADGGSPRQLTDGPYDHDGGLSWVPDGESLIVGGDRHEAAEYEPLDSELYEVAIADGATRAITDRRGPDTGPVVSPDGKHIAYTGFDDEVQGYQITRLYVMRRDGSDAKVLTADLDRDVGTPQWSRDSRTLYLQYADHGVGKVAAVGLDGRVRDVATGGGGADLGRPYEGFTFSVSDQGTVAYTQSDPEHPAEVAIAGRRGEARRLTALNDDVLGYRQLGKVERIELESSADQRKLEGWLVYPAEFKTGPRYPLILEIHGGPFAAYGPHFSAEVQLYAAAGYAVLYMNPRGSTSYGGEFGNLIHHSYPSQDYDDLMSGVDAVVARGFVDPERLYVTGGSGGGVLTAWIVGKTDRFRAAVSAKPVINWTSFVLTADATNFFYKYWFDGYPWDDPEQYWKRSPLSLVGNVKTPTMMLTGEQDYRTPISEAEQFYQALRLRKVDALLVRIPGASHSIAARPSQLIAKTMHILAWFEKYGGEPAEAVIANP